MDPITVLDGAAPRAISSSTNASPIVLTVAAGHGLVDGDRVIVKNHETNTAANGEWEVTVSGNDITLVGSTGNGVGGATGVVCKQPKKLYVKEMDTVTLMVDTDGGGDAAFTFQCVGSILEDAPDFGDDQSASNQYEYLQMVDLEDGAVIDGDTGFVVATADDHRAFEINVNNSFTWISFIPTAGTAGEITVRAKLSRKER